MTEPHTPQPQRCANCGTGIVRMDGLWLHTDGRGTYCRPGDKPLNTGTYLDSPGMREAHLRSARGDW